MKLYKKYVNKDLLFLHYACFLQEWRELILIFKNKKIEKLNKIILDKTKKDKQKKASLSEK